MRIPSPFVAFAGFALLASAWSVPAMARTLRVDPVLIEIDGHRRTASVTVTNGEDVPVTIRTHALTWRQEGGDNHYERTSDLILSPPVFTIAANATQVIRIGERRPSNIGKAYRLIVEEVPEASPGGGIRVALRLDLPFFVNIVASDSSRLVWRVARRPDGNWVVEARNPGTGYVRIDHSTATSATGLEFGDDIFFGTLLPNGVRRWLIGRDPEVVDRARLQRIFEGDQVAPSRTALDPR